MSNALFSIGQKVVCVNSKPKNNTVIPSPLVEGKVYTVVAQMQCSCGKVGLDVALPHKYGKTKCDCGSIVISDIWWVNQNRFVPLDFDRQADEEIHQALKGIKIEN